MAARKQLLRSLIIRNARRPALNFSYWAAGFVSAADASGSRTVNKHRPPFPGSVEHGVVIDQCGIPFSPSRFRRYGTTESSGNDEKDANSQSEDETDGEGQDSDGWEDDDESEPEYGDGGAGGGVVLQNVPWGEHVLSIAREILLQFGNDMELYAFKTTPRGYIFIRLDKLSNRYGCPDIKELEKFHQEYNKKLDETGKSREIPDDLAIEVSSPGAERLLRVPDDLKRFKDLPMRVCYIDEESKRVNENVFLLENIDTESCTCEWKLADVKANSDLTGKGRPLSRKLKDWRLKLSYPLFKKVSLYLES